MIGLAALAAIAGLCLLVPLATLIVRGRALSALVLPVLPRLPGKLHADGITLHPRLLFDFITDRPTPVEVAGFSVIDPEGTEVLYVPHVAVKIRPRTAIGGRVVLEDVVIAPGARWRFAQMKRSEHTGFLAAFNDPDEPSTPRKPGEEGILFSLASAELQGMDVAMDFPDAFSLAFKDVRSWGSLLVHDGFVGWAVKDFDARGGGFFDTLDEHLPWDRVRVKEAGTSRARPDDILIDLTEALTSTKGGSDVPGPSRLSGRGYLTGIYGYGVPEGQPSPPPGIDMDLRVENAAPAAAAVLAPHELPQLHFGGDATATASLRGKFIEVRIDARVTGLEARWNDLPAHDIEGHVTIDAAEPFTFAVEDVRFAGGSGGRFQGRGSWRGDEVKARVALSNFGTAAYLPETVEESIGGSLEGGLSFAANVETRALAFDDVDLRLAPHKRSPVTHGKPVRVAGRARATPQSATTEDLVIELPGTRVTARGRYGVAHQLLGFGLRATAAELPRLLAVWDVPSLARRGHATLDVTGKPANPRGTGTVDVEDVTLPGLPVIPRFGGKVELEKGLLSLIDLRGDAYGGTITGGGTVRLWRGDILDLLSEPLVALKGQARGLDLAQMFPSGVVTGRLDLDADATGPSDRVVATLRAPEGTPIGLFGGAWRVAGWDLAATADELTIKKLRLESAQGGHITLGGKAVWDGPIAVSVDVSGVPVAGLPGLAKGGVPVDGQLTSHLQLTGTMERPLVEGEVALENVSARGVHLGRGVLRLSSTEDGAVVAAGDLFGRITVAGRLAYDANGPLLNLSGKFHEVLIEQFFPELVAFGNARARVTGGVDISYGGLNPLTVDLRLSDVELSADRDLGGGGGAGHSGRLSVRNATPVRVVLAGNQVIVDRTRLVTEGGELKLWGEVKDDVVNAELAGSLALELLQPLLGRRVEGLGGEVNLELQVSGTPQHPVGAGRLDVVRPIVVRLPGIAPSIMVPTAAVRVDKSAITLGNVVVESEGGKLRLAGRARFDERQSVNDLDFEATGDLGGALLEAVGGGSFSDASGRARLDVRITGTPAAPQVKGALNLAGLNFRLRELGRDVAMESGLVELAGQDVVIRNFRARVDGQGELLLGVAPDPPGRIGLRGAWPAPSLGAVRLPVRGHRISVRASNAVELDDIGFDLDLGGDPARGLSLEGEVTVASGRYVRNFNVRELVITPSIDESEVEPFWAGSPLLQHLNLKLRLRTLGDTFVVRNNLVPQLNVAFDLLVQGTLSQPRIAGEVRPTEGTFRLFGIRQVFDLLPNVNQITFVETKSLERGETPEVNLEAETLVNDTTNQEHRVRMRISGPIGRAHIDLSTDTGLARNQALLLLISGRTGDTDSVLGAAGKGGAGSSLGAGGTDVIGQLFSDFLEPYVDDALAKLPVVGSLNLRPTLGPEGLEVRADFRPSRLFDLRLSLLRGFEGRSQYRFESRLWLMDYLTLRGLGEQNTYSTQENLVEPSQSLKLELTMDFPIRLFLR